MSYNRSNLLRYFFGTMLSLSGLFASWYAVRVAYAKIAYQRIKFREPDITLSEAHQTAQGLHSIYPHNYHLSEWMAEKAFYDHGDTDIAATWVDIGLAQNPHRLNMRWIETLLVGMDDPEEAARLWEAYSDDVFWNRWVMAGRVYWLARAGRIDEAEHYMALLRQMHGDHGWAEQELTAARAAAE